MFKLPHTLFWCWMTQLLWNMKRLSAMAICKWCQLTVYQFRWNLGSKCWEHQNQQSSGSKMTWKFSLVTDLKSKYYLSEINHQFQYFFNCRMKRMEEVSSWEMWDSVTVVTSNVWPQIFLEEQQVWHSWSSKVKTSIFIKYLWYFLKYFVF